jgi:hypothetical protein
VDSKPHKELTLWFTKKIKNKELTLCKHFYTEGALLQAFDLQMASAQANWVLAMKKD